MRHFPWRLDVDQPWGRINPTCLLVNAQKMFAEGRKKMDSQILKDCVFLIMDARAMVKYTKSVRQIWALPGYFCTKTELIGTVRVGSHCWKRQDWNLRRSSIFVWGRVIVFWAAWTFRCDFPNNVKLLSLFSFLFGPYSPFPSLLSCAENQAQDLFRARETLHH